MCHFITGTLPSANVPDSAQAIAAAHQLQFEPLRNAFVLGQLREGEGYFRLTRQWCDCGTPWYSGVLESERVQLQRRQRLLRSEITSDVLSRLEADVLYEFRWEYTPKDGGASGTSASRQSVPHER